MSDGPLVLVRIGNKTVPVHPGFAQRKELEVLDESAYDRFGEIKHEARGKPKTTVAKAAAKKASDASTQKENTK